MAVRFRPIADISLAGADYVAVFKNDFFVALFGLSCFCVLVLVGLYAYSGSLLPSTEGASQSEALEIWLLWIAVAGVPVTALLWWLGDRLRRRR